MITYHKSNFLNNPKCSILIPSWNNLPYLKVCIDSIRKNSHFNHQVIVHVNEGKDGTLNWLKDKNIDYSHSNKNVGICLAVNTAFSLAQADYIIYMNDDMYACPDWDRYLWEDIEKIEHNDFFLSATMIEHTYTGNSCVLAPFDFGKTPDTFDENALLEKLSTLNFHDWQGSTWPPNIVHRDLWKKVDGFSIEFSPGMYSDPDFAMKLWQAEVRYFKGIGKSKVYHFQSKSTGKIKKNDGKKQFLRKWGICSSTFTKKILKTGQPFIGRLNDQSITPGIKDKIRRIIINLNFPVRK